MKAWARIFFGLIALVIVAWILKKIDFSQVYSLILQADYNYFLLAFFSAVVGFVILNVKSIYIIRKVVKPGFWFNIKTFLAGRFVDTITPGAQVGGDPVRAYYLGERYGKSKTKVFGAVLADRVLHFAVSLFFIVASLIYVLRYVSVEPELKILLQTTLFFIISASFFIFLVNIRKKKVDLRWILRKFIWIDISINGKNKKKRFEKIWLERFGNFLRTFKQTLKDGKTLAAGMLLSFLYWLLHYAISYLLFLSFNIDVRFFMVIVIVSLAEIVGDLSPSPGGIGLIEGFMILAYSAIGLNLYAATAVSLLSRIIFYFFSLLLGGISLVQLEATSGLKQGLNGVDKIEKKMK